jgi:hypothetical protein
VRLGKEDGKSIRILFWSGPFWPYTRGAEIFASKLFLAFRERGYEIIVVTRQDAPDLLLEDQNKGIAVYRLPFWTALMDRFPQKVRLFFLFPRSGNVINVKSETNVRMGWNLITI